MNKSKSAPESTLSATQIICTFVPYFRLSRIQEKEIDKKVSANRLYYTAKKAENLIFSYINQENR